MRLHVARVHEHEEPFAAFGREIPSMPARAASGESYGELGVIDAVSDNHIGDIRTSAHPGASLHDSHSRTKRSRNALPMTETELKLMAAAAMTGLSRRPKAG